jgi:RecA/RadA recombinase
MAKPVEKPQYQTKEERLAAIKRLARATNTNAGMECVTMADDLPATRRAPFGIPEVDEKIGGGIVHGAFTVLWGDAGSGKTTAAMDLAARAQKDGKLVAWAALERFDKERAVEHGINLDEMPILQFPKAEGVLDTMIEYGRNKLVDVFILDSIHSLSPKGVQENSKGSKSLEDETMGVLARKLSTFFPMAMDPVKRSEIAVLLIGQTRMKIGFVSIEDLTGGNALKHASRLTIHLRHGKGEDAPVRTEYVQDGDKKKKVETTIGFNSVWKFDKVQVPGCQPEKTSFGIPFYYESGFFLPAHLREQIAQEEAEIKAQDAPEDVKTDKPAPEAPVSENVASAPVKRGRGRPKTKGV